MNTVRSNQEGVLPLYRAIRVIRVIRVTRAIAVLDEHIQIKPKRYIPLIRVTKAIRVTSPSNPGL